MLSLGYKMAQPIENGIIIDLTNSGQSILEYSPPSEVFASADRQYLDIKDEKEYFVFCNICQYADPSKQFVHGTNCTHVMHREVCFKIIKYFAIVKSIY